LASAAAVPLGAAALYAAGLLDWGPRLLLGVALVVLGTAIRRTESTVTGARIGPGASRAIGITVIVGGSLTIGGALVAAVVDRGPGSAWAPLLLCAALGTAGAWIARDRPAIGGVVAAVAAVQGWLVLLEALGVGPELVFVLTVLPAAALTVVAVRGGGPPPVRAGIGTAAALLIIARTTTEVTGISMLGTGLVPSVFDADAWDPATGWVIAQVLLAQLTLVVLLATAFVRRDPAGGALAGAALLVGGYADDTVLRVAWILVPAVVVVGLTGAIRSAGLRRRLTGAVPAVLREAGWTVSSDVARAAWSVAVVITVAHLSADSKVLAGIAVVALLAATAAAWSVRGAAATVAGAVVVVGWATIQPLVELLGGTYGANDGLIDVAGLGSLDQATTVAIGTVATVVVAACLIVRTRTAAVAAAAVFAVVMGVSLTLVLATASDENLVWALVALLAPPVVSLVVAAGLAAAGPARWVATAQAMSAASAGSAMGALLALPSLVLWHVFGDGAEPITDGARLVMVLLLVGLAFGGTLLAASTARRASTVAVLGAVAAAFGTAVLAATVSTAVGDARVELPADPGLDFAPLTPVLGFDWGAGLLRVADPGWPVLFGVVGLVLLGAATWLESRRPVPADAPLAPRDD